MSFEIGKNQSTPPLHVAMLKYTLLGWLITLEKTVNTDNSKTAITKYKYRYKTLLILANKNRLFSYKIYKHIIH